MQQFNFTCTGVTSWQQQRCVQLRTLDNNKKAQTSPGCEQNYEYPRVNKIVKIHVDHFLHKTTD